jgi:hypothetical protein
MISTEGGMKIVVSEEELANADSLIPESFESISNATVESCTQLDRQLADKTSIPDGIQTDLRVSLSSLRSSKAVIPWTAKTTPETQMRFRGKFGDSNREKLQQAVFLLVAK